MSQRRGFSSIEKQRLWTQGSPASQLMLGGARTLSPKDLSISVSCTLVGLMFPQDMTGLCALPLEGHELFPAVGDGEMCPGPGHSSVCLPG